MICKDHFTVFGVTFTCEYEYYDGRHEVENPQIEVDILRISIRDVTLSGLLMCEEIEQKLVEEIKKSHED